MKIADGVISTSELINNTLSSANQGEVFRTVPIMLHAIIHKVAADTKAAAASAAYEKAKADLAAAEAGASGPEYDAAKQKVGRIVGRDTSALSAQEVRTAALETLAENLSDGVIAPTA